MGKLVVRVEGVPQAKGSMRAYAKRVAENTYRGILTHSAASKQWEAEIRLQLPAQAPLDGAIQAELEFVLPRGKTVTRDRPSVVPDLDKLVRAVLDALQTTKKLPGVITDDSRITELTARKRYSQGRG